MTEKKILKLEVTKNYLIIDYQNPPDSKILSYKRKSIIDKDGYKNILTLAIIKDKDGNTKTTVTSFWKPLNKPSNKRFLRSYLEKNPTNVHFFNNDIKKKYLKESIVFSKSIVKYLELNEGFVRGVLGDVKDSFTLSISELFNSLKSFFGSSTTCLKIIDQKAKNIKYFIEDSKEFNAGEGKILKYLGFFERYQYLFVLDDEYYYTMLEGIKKNKINKFLIRIDFQRRLDSKLFKMRTKDELNKLVDMYVFRVSNVYKECIKNKINSIIVKYFMNIFVQGIIDLEFMTRKVVRYNE